MNEVYIEIGDNLKEVMLAAIQKAGPNNVVEVIEAFDIELTDISMMKIAKKVSDMIKRGNVTVLS